MKVSEITENDVAEYLRTSDTTQLKIMLDSAKSYVRSYTGLTDDEIDKHEDITHAIFVLVSDMYDNRAIEVKSDKANMVVSTILNMYCANLL